MVEPISVGAIVAALLANALNRAENGVVDGGVEVARRAIETLRWRFAHDGDAEAEQTLDDLAKAPDSERREKALAVLLEDRASRSAELRDELETVVEQGEAAGVVIGPIDQVAEGEGIVQNAGNVNSQISVNQSPRQPRD